MKKLVTLLIILTVIVSSICSAMATSWVFPVDESDKRVVATTDTIQKEYEVFLKYCINKIFGQESTPSRINMVQMCVVVPTKEVTVYTSDGYDWIVNEDMPFVVLCFEDTFTKSSHIYVGWNAGQGPLYKSPGFFYTITGEIDDTWFGEVCTKTCETGNVKIYIFDNI